MNQWTKQEDETLLRLKERKLSYLDIAEVLDGKTTDALRNRFYVLTHKDRTIADVETQARVLIYDIETSLMNFVGFNTGKVHYIPKGNLLSEYYIVSWAARWAGDEEVFSATMRPSEAKRHDDKRILRPIWKLMDEADIVVGHNVDRFDTRRMNTRFMKHGMQLPRRFRSVDTLKIARKYFDLPYNDLDYVCQYFGLPVRKKEHEGFDMWMKCFYGDQDALNQMQAYNIQDVEATEGLYNFLKTAVYELPKPFKGGWKKERI